MNSRCRPYSPPIQLCTPYHTQAMTERFKTGQRDPQIPKDALPTTGKAMWYFAPILPVRTMKPPAMAYPIHTQSHDCHQARPGFMMLADEIIHVLMLKESAIQNATW